MKDPKTKHTPGPWESVISEESTGVWAYIGPINNKTDNIAKIDACNESRQADAQLIAAAPDLLEALQLASNALIELMDCKGSLTTEAHYKAIEAIKKATGGNK